MNYEIHSLELFEPLICSFSEDTRNGILFLCESGKDSPIVNYAATSQNPEIPAGTYFFVQGFIQGSDQPFAADTVPVPEIAEAAEALGLEFIWQEKKAADSRIFLRILHEGDKKNGGAVFQLFRRLA
jgi:hypothetical protein